jgi:hypothetical protein
LPPAVAVQIAKSLNPSTRQNDLRAADPRHPGDDISLTPEFLFLGTGTPTRIFQRHKIALSWPGLFHGRGHFDFGGGIGVIPSSRALYAPDATVLPTIEPIWQGEAGKKYWIDVTNGFTGPTETTTAVEGRGDMAYAVGTYRGAKPPTEEGKYLEVLKEAGRRAVLTVQRSPAPG